MIFTKTAIVFVTKLRVLKYQFIIRKLHKSDLEVYKNMDKKLRKLILNKNYCHSTNVMGVVLSTSNPFQDDAKSPEQESESFRPFLQENIEKEIVKKIVIAKNALDDKKTEKAEKALENAVALGEKSNGLPLGLTCAYEMLASLACEKGDITKAENLVISALKKLKTVQYSCSDNLVISFSMKLARLYKEDNKVEAAEIIFRKCLDAQERKYYKGHTDPETAQLWVNTLFWYGKLLFERNRYQEAVKCFETCYHLSCQVKTIQIPQVMVILHNLAEASYFTGDKDKALRHLKHAIMIGRLVNFSDLPIFYVRIGNIYAQKGEFQEAKIWCEGARKISKMMKNKVQESEADTTLKEIDKCLENL